MPALILTVVSGCSGDSSGGDTQATDSETTHLSPENTHEFAERLMREVWEPFDASAVERFYHRDVRGHHRSQELGYEDVVHRLRSDTGRYANSLYDIKDIVATEDKFAIRFIYTATMVETGDPVRTEVNYFYHLKDDKISEFWLLSDMDFDYKAQA